MILRIIVLFLILTASAYAEDSAFVYDAHGKKDPFLPLVSPTGDIISYDSELTATEMHLEGIVADPKGDNVAIINGKVLKTHDTIGTYVIAAIASDHVDLTKGEDKVTIALKKGDM